ncbi:alpha/beta hydrolase [Nocardioides sp. cx-173]|uniref:alpha/beta hydrolase n=1 Tax=Nocardioides sp. cx-173 TaxID=2898796 RepID=UPI001E51D343|nr:hypothetical protein [Nocardioides sp. cx-173]MCD4526662.1 hypothetical protein [Nocardioides sp. cx-173]UGB42595.1 hypothetical protein LQ940_03490 [Nocardioides sp. cx-173]
MPHPPERPRTRPRLRRACLVAVLVAALGLAGCAGEESQDEGAGSPTDRGAPPTETTAEAWDDQEDVAEQCLSDTPAAATIRPATLRGPGMDLRAAAVLPPRSSGAAVVMLPQAGSPGLCGWLPYAATLTARGIASLSIDPCGSGASACDDDRAAAVADQVDLAARWLRREAGARTVVVLGASMGGSLAVRATAQGAAVDAWVDLSGPSAWDGVHLLGLAPRLTTPGLVARARRDGASSEFRAARELAARAGARFLALRDGHGWDLVLTLEGAQTTTGRVVADFIATTRPGSRS